MTRQEELLKNSIKEISFIVNKGIDISEKILNAGEICNCGKLNCWNDCLETDKGES